MAWPLVEELIMRLPFANLVVFGEDGRHVLHGRGARRHRLLQRVQAEQVQIKNNVQYSTYSSENKMYKHL